MISCFLKSLSLCLIASFVLLQPGYAQKADSKAGTNKAVPVLWTNPGDIGSRDLFYGPGSAKLKPVPPFTFIEEDKGGASPKFHVLDARGIKWSVKLGPEAQAETVATRFVWAVGYFAEEAYYFDKVHVKDLPRLARGHEYVKDGSTVHGVRFEPRRGGFKSAGTWDWSKNPFSGTRHLDGLKVLMVLLNNYDARPENNKILINESTGRNRPAARYVVTDLGATLGRAGGLGGTRSKNDLEDLLSTRFVLGVEDGAVKFDYDTRPTGFGVVSIVYPPYYFAQVKKEKSMRGIPVGHARWIGSLLSQLSRRQLQDAFRAAGYDKVTAESYVGALSARIGQLRRL